MTEIAKLTNVSQPTVSRVLNGSKRVAPEIRERVLACAKEHDYQLNALAKGLQGSKTYLLGLLVTDISDDFTARLAKQVEAEARNRGYSTILFNSDDNARNEQECLDVVRRYRVDGLLAVPGWETGSQWREYAKKLDAPIVTVARRTEGLDSIYADRVQAGAAAADYLAGRGYRRFLFAGRDYDGAYTGFRQALEAKGLGEQTCSAFYEDGDQLRQALRTWARAGWGRAAVFAGSDAYALQVLDALRELGLSVPGNVGVVGFGDTFACRYLNPRLSSVSQPVEQMARSAVDRLMERIDHPELKEPLDLPLQASLVVREST